MTRSIGRQAGVQLVAAALLALSGATAAVVAGLGVDAAPAGAATDNPCKIVKKAEIQRAFGGTVSTGRKGFSTAVTTQCEFQVGANGDRPSGTVVVHVLSTGAKAAYTGLKKTAAYAPIDGVPNSLYAEKLHVAEILHGNVLVGVQGGFLITDPLPIHSYDDKTQLTDLAQLASTRV
jgi:hypothetical protein